VAHNGFRMDKQSLGCWAILYPATLLPLTKLMRYVLDYIVAGSSEAQSIQSHAMGLRRGNQYTLC